MKRKIITIFLTALLLNIFFTLNIAAQVTIGSELPPNPGSLLDLKQYTPTADNSTSDRGLLLPRVTLVSGNDLAPAIVGASPEDKAQHAGLCVYHTGNQQLCSGVYTWSGGNWVRIPKPCVVNVICSSITANGTLVVGTPLNASNTVTLQLSVPKESAGGTYNIYSNDVNGIRFSGTGTLAAGAMTVTLQGSGTPKTGGRDYNFAVSFEFSNSESSTAICSFTIPGETIPIATSGIFGFGLAAGTFGYHLESSASRAMMLSSNNFGTAANSTVNTSGVTFTAPLNIDGLTVPNFVNSVPFQSNPDIIINGYYSFTSAPAVIDALAEYLNKGGVLILLDELNAATNLTVQLCKKLFPLEAAGISQTTLGGSGSIYTMTSTVDDEITNGPFGDVKGTFWGEDASSTFGIAGLPADSITAYSTGSYTNSAGVISNNPSVLTMFKHKRLNLFFVGDGGFNSNSNTFIGNNYTDRLICPLSIDASMRPIPRINWGAGGAYTVHNSVIFANIMAWAVKNAPSNNKK